MKPWNYTKLKSEKQIPQRKLEAVWKANFNKPMPKIMAFELKYRDYVKYNNSYENSDPERKKLCDEMFLREHGKIVTFEQRVATMIPLDEEGTGFLILTRQNPNCKLEEMLLHEFRHIFNKDWKTKQL